MHVGEESAYLERIVILEAGVFGRGKKTRCVAHVGTMPAAFAFGVPAGEGVRWGTPVVLEAVVHAEAAPPVTAALGRAVKVR